MKKFFIKFIIFIILICSLVFVMLKTNKKEKNIDLLDNVEEQNFIVNNYYVFGTHLNLSGYIDEELTDNLNLILKSNDNEIELPSNFNVKNGKTSFKTSKKNNEGIYLDSIEQGEYYLFVKQSNEDTTKYYSLKNDTKYNNIEYYTITSDNKNNKIDIFFDSKNNIEYLKFNIVEDKLPDNIYDISIDPGHGGKDSGSLYVYKGKTYKESDLTLAVSLKLKEKLEKEGYKVIITREDDSTLESFDENNNIGRASIANKVKAKYSFSIHLNSYYKKMSYGGVEVYTPNDIDLKLANMLANNLSTIVGYSKKGTNRISNGVYYEYLTEKDIKEYAKELEEKKLKPYDMVLGSPYMYMIRELGGIVTHAYMDGRNEEHGYNKYYNSNQVVEPYLIELCYINYKSDFLNVLKSPDKFASKISEAIDEYLKEQK